MRILSIILMLGVLAVLSECQTHSVKNPAVVHDPKLRKVYELIYPFYQRPRYRYPFYDHQGNGELLYGYGGRKLFKYTVFKPVEGYLR
ncbi:hypothetical protein Pmani_029222 [Petrolisthes manimaculis]|uniref:Uncharacterized protein n=1 Tax=Petrolisthes manimaculis TaxID=1843537 RepID=A0AAE1TX77_9EUCA|nr:hypothetical protein Pmani_029222 [Petrolisthes manimaculis]